MQRVVTELVDDLDGGKAEQTVEFAVQGVQYEIDLSGKNVEQMRKALEKYISAARRIGGRAKRSPASKPTRPDREQTRAIREWATRQGIEVSYRGRIAERVVKAYEDAH